MQALAATLDPARTRVALRTRAVGLFSPLAHDLELLCGAASGEATRTSDDAWAATLRFPVADIHVAGALRRGHVDPTVLSERDRREIDRRVREDVLALPTIEVRVALAGRDAALTIVGPGGAHGVSVPVSVDEVLVDAAHVVAGRFSLSLAALGVKPVKGPLGTFQLADEVQVDFRATFRDSSGAPSP